MFGRKERGASVLEFPDALQVVTDDASKKETFQKLPDFIVARFKELDSLTSEFKTLTSTRTEMKLPRGQEKVYQERIAVLERQMGSLWRIAEAIRHGYEPYTMSSNFYVGTVDGADFLPNMFMISTKFNAPMPKAVIEKYERARRNGLFNRILVGSADPSLFETVPAPLTREPVMVGYIPTGEGPVMYREKRARAWIRTNKIDEVPTPGLEVKNLTGFLIAQWDLGVEVKAALKDS